MQSQQAVLSSSDSSPDNAPQGLLPHIQSQEPMYNMHGTQGGLYGSSNSGNAMHSIAEYTHELDIAKQPPTSKANNFLGGPFRSSFSAYSATPRSRNHSQNTVVPPQASYREQSSGFYSSPAETFSPHLTSPTQQHPPLFDARASYDYGNGSSSLPNGLHKTSSFSHLVDPYAGQPASLVHHGKASQQQNINGFGGPFSNGVHLSSQTPFGPHIPSPNLPINGNSGMGPTSSGILHAGAAGGQGGQQQEDISTIFVVGFPDDMQEREFQNMFTFSTGFEAATLKIPNKEYSSYGGVGGSNANTSAHLGMRGSTGGFGQYGSNDPYNVVNVSQGGVIVDSRDGPMSWPNALDDGNAVTGVPPPHFPGGASSMPPRKQIIGFAKFRTREEALIARDVLQGRRVDIEKGAVLKAEMAKKNLHTKRGVGPVSSGNVSSAAVSGNFTQPMLNTNSAGVLPQPIISNGHTDTYSVPTELPPMSSLERELGAINAMGLSRTAWRDEMVPVSNGLHMTRESVEEERRLAAVGAMGLSPATRGARERAEGEERRRKEKDALRFRNPSAFDAFHSVPSQTVGASASSLSLEGISSGSSVQVHDGFGQYSLNQPALSVPAADDDGPIGPWDTTIRPDRHPSSHRSSSPTNPSVSSQSHSGHSKPPSESLGSDPYQGSRSSSATDESQSGGECVGKAAADADLAAGVSGLALNTRHVNTSPQLPSPESGASSSGTRSGVDQYPAINTLYVGNLPTSPTPPGLPPDILEQSLRELFSAQPGFRRLSFKQKSTGPMCFVEFEDVNYATKTMDELYGNSVNGLVKGAGIRLSYSKNPLGVRTPTSASSNGSTLQQQQQQQSGYQSDDTRRRDMPATSYMSAPTPPRFFAASPTSAAAFGPPQPGPLTGSSNTLISRSSNINGYTPPLSSSFSPFAMTSHPQTFIPEQDVPDHQEPHSFSPGMSPSASNVEAAKAA